VSESLLSQISTVVYEAQEQYGTEFEMDSAWYAKLILDTVRSHLGEEPK